MTPLLYLVKQRTTKTGNGRSVEIAAKAVGVSPNYVDKAAAVMRQNPDAFQQIKRGELTGPPGRIRPGLRTGCAGNVPEGAAHRNEWRASDAHLHETKPVVEACMTSPRV